MPDGEQKRERLYNFNFSKRCHCCRFEPNPTVRLVRFESLTSGHDLFRSTETVTCTRGLRGTTGGVLPRAPVSAIRKCVHLIFYNYLFCHYTTPLSNALKTKIYIIVHHYTP